MDDRISFRLPTADRRPQNDRETCCRRPADGGRWTAGRGPPYHRVLTSMEWLLFLGGLGTILIVALVWWRRLGALEWWKRRQVAIGAWELRACPHCRGSGRCRSCQGLGTMGLMGPPCMDCGGGESVTALGDAGSNERARSQQTVMGTGRCATCGGTGQAFYEVSTGHTIADNAEALAAARLRHQQVESKP